MDISSANHPQERQEGGEHRFAALFKLGAALLATIALSAGLFFLIPPPDRLVSLVPQEAAAYIHADAGAARRLFTLPAGLVASEAATYALPAEEGLRWHLLLRVRRATPAQRTALADAGFFTEDGRIYSSSAPATPAAASAPVLPRLRRHFSLTGFVQPADLSLTAALAADISLDEPLYFGANLTSRGIAAALAASNANSGNILLARMLTMLGADRVSPSLAPDAALAYSGSGSLLPLTRVLLPSAFRLNAIRNLDATADTAYAERTLAQAFSGPVALSIGSNSPSFAAAFPETDPETAKAAILQSLGAIPDLATLQLPDGTTAQEYQLRPSRLRWEAAGSQSTLRDPLTDTALFLGAGQPGTRISSIPPPAHFPAQPAGQLLWPHALTFRVPTTTSAMLPHFLHAVELSTVHGAVTVDNIVILSIIK